MVTALEMNGTAFENDLEGNVASRGLQACEINDAGLHLKGLTKLKGLEWQNYRKLSLTARSFTSRPAA